jgi:hypothetical protein
MVRVSGWVGAVFRSLILFPWCVTSYSFLVGSVGVSDADLSRFS